MNEWEWQLLEERTPVDRVPHAAGELRAGTRVRLRPRARGGDAMDLLLAGKTAVIEAIEQDYEGTIHLALVFDDDPGRDLGLLRQPGHRFFYAPDEVELCAEQGEAAAAASVPRPASAPQILVAGIGNIFLGDDGFGVEVVRRLASRALPAGVRVVDYGIRGLDLAYALADGPDVTILVDACPRGEPPGTLFVIEADPGEIGRNEPAMPDAHALNPVLVLRMAQAMGATLERVLLVGCEPATLGPDEGQLGLSETVAAAVDGAVDLVVKLVRELHEGGSSAGGREPIA